MWVSSVMVRADVSCCVVCNVHAADFFFVLAYSDTLCLKGCHKDGVYFATLYSTIQVLGETIHPVSVQYRVGATDRSPFEWILRCALQRITSKTVSQLTTPFEYFLINTSILMNTSIPINTSILLNPSICYCLHGLGIHS